VGRAWASGTFAGGPRRQSGSTGHDIDFARAGIEDGGCRNILK
jgi:hypothetical protein